MHSIVRINLLLSVVSYLVLSSLTMATSQNMQQPDELKNIY